MNIVNNMLIIDQDRLDQTDTKRFHQLYSLLNFIFVVDYKNNIFYYLKNRLTGETNKTYSLDRLDYHLEVIKEFQDISDKYQAVCEKVDTLFV